MISKFSKGRVFVFIDAANLLYSQRTLDWKVSYSKLKNYLDEELEEPQLILYLGEQVWNPQQKKFFKLLFKLGYKVVSKPIKIIESSAGRVWKGNLDIELAVDAMENKDEFDTMVLFSGDSDFAYLLKRLKYYRKRVIVLSTRGHISKELLEEAKYIDIRKLRVFLEQ